MNWVIFSVNLLVILSIAIVVQRKLDVSIQSYYWPAFIVKMTAGISLGLVYTFAYSSGDTFYLFEESVWMADYFHSDPMGYFKSLWDESNLPTNTTITIEQPRSLFFVKTVSLLAIVSHNNYWISALYLSLFSFLASFWFFKQVIKNVQVTAIHAAIAILFFPSVVFWSSGIIKESLASAALLVLSVYFLKILFKDRVNLLGWILIALSFWLLWSLKYYWVALFVPVTITSLLISSIRSRLGGSTLKTVLIWVFVFLAITVGVSFLHPNFNLDRLLNVVVENNSAYAELSDPTDLIHFNGLQPTWMSIIMNSPWALISGLFRPFLWEVDSLLKFIISLEGLLIFALIAGQAYRLKKIHVDHKPLILSILFYSILLCIFLSLSTPNLGSLSRYKVGFLPFLLLLLTNENPILAWVGKYFKQRFN